MSRFAPGSLYISWDWTEHRALRQRGNPARACARPSTLIRHRGHDAAFAIGPLTIPMIEPAFEALLVTTISSTVLLPSSLLPTTLTAITLPTITGTADPELHSTSGRFAETMTENRFRHRIDSLGVGSLLLAARDVERPTTKNPGCRNNQG